MASVNKAIIMGHLGHPPSMNEVNGDKVANFNVATNYYYKDKDGNKQDKTEWHRIVLWGRLAEIAEQYLKKGSPVYIEGRLQTREWKDKEDNKRWTTEIVGQSMQLLGKKSNGEVGSEFEPAPPEDDGMPW